MRRTKILNATEVKRTSYTEAANAFYRHCKLKNLRPRTITYYKEDLTYSATSSATVLFISSCFMVLPPSFGPEMLAKKEPFLFHLCLL